MTQAAHDVSGQFTDSRDGGSGLEGAARLLGGRGGSGRLVRPPLGLDARSIQQLAQALRGTGYPGPNPESVLGPRFGSSHARADMPLFLKRLAEPTPLNLQVKLFALGVALKVEEAAIALNPLGVEDAVGLGVVEVADGWVWPWVGISEMDDVLVAHDAAIAEQLKGAADRVLGVNPAAGLLALLTERRSCRAVLDIGTGGGVQALLAAGHAAAVVGVDTNARALDYGRFNALLNGVTTIEYLEGSLFQPVAGRRFDLIVANPPYVISPESRYIYRDSGMGEDSMCQRIIREGPAYLEEGGKLFMLCNWALRDGETGVEPLQRWVEGTGCDAWLIHSSTQDPLSYAAGWNRESSPEEYAEALDRWMRYYEVQGIRRIGLGGVVLRRRSGGVNWVRGDVVPGSPVESCSDLVEGVFRTEDLFAQADGGRSVLERRWVAGGRHRVLQTWAARDGVHGVTRLDIEVRNGFTFHASIDPLGFKLLTCCDGSRVLGEIVRELGEAASMEPAVAVEVGLAMVRRMLALGILIPAEGPEKDLGVKAEPPSGG